MAFCHVQLELPRPLVTVEVDAQNHEIMPLVGFFARAGPTLVFSKVSHDRLPGGGIHMFETRSELNNAQFTDHHQECMLNKAVQTLLLMCLCYGAQ